MDRRLEVAMIAVGWKLLSDETVHLSQTLEG